MPILNVEDYGPARFVRTRVLERAGFSVVEAETLAEARRLMAEQVPQLVLLDLRLPDGSGMDLCEFVKAEQPAVPVVLITSTYTTADARRDGFRAGADAFLLEPVPSDALLRTVRQFTAPTRTETAAPPLVVTDGAGTIVRVNEGAARLLNLTPRAARGRGMLPFFAEMRTQILDDIRRAAGGHIVQRVVTIRPRERKPFVASLDLSAEGDELHWTFGQGD